MSKCRKILLIRPDKAGDALKTLPALRALKNSRPEADYYILASDHNQSLFAFEPGYALLRLPSKWETLEKSALETWASEVGIIFDLAIHLPCDLFPETKRLLEILPAKVIHSTAWNHSKPPSNVEILKPGVGAKTDETINVAKILESALEVSLVHQLKEFSNAPILSEIDELEARLVLGNKTGYWLGLCPLAGNNHRTHPVGHWKRFLEKMSLKHQAERMFLFGSPTDREALETLRQTCANPKQVNIVIASSFRALGAYLLRMDGVVAVDSGPLHLSQALKVPSLGFLSGGDSKRWFARLGSKDKLILRGWWHRYPSPRQMLRAFWGWSPTIAPA